MNFIKKTYYRFQELLVIFIVRLLGIKRRKDLWVFSDFKAGGFGGNPKYLYLWMLKNTPSVKPVWLAKTEDDFDLLKSRDLPVVRRNGWKGSFYVAVAFVWVTSITLSNFRKGRTKWRMKGMWNLNLWHGVGLKNLEAQLPGAIGTCYGEGIKKERFILCTSEAIKPHFSNAFQIPPEQCIEAGYPKLQYLIDKDMYEGVKSIFPESLHEMTGIPADWEIVLYAPTFRDKGPIKVWEALGDLTMLNEALRDSRSVMFVKLHSNDVKKADMSALAGLDSIKIWPGDEDAYQHWDEIDVLITDYSSILYDFLAVNKRRVVLFPYDLNYYKTQCRDLILSYEDYTVGAVCMNSTELVDILRKGVSPAEQEKTDRIVEYFWGYGQEDSCRKIVDHVMEITRDYPV